jgi:hypothetical protein
MAELKVGEIVHRCEGDGQCTEHLVTHIDRRGWAETVRLDPDIRGFVSHLAVWPEEGFNRWAVLHRVTGIWMSILPPPPPSCSSCGAVKR